VGTSTSVGEFAAKIDQAAASIRDAQRDAVADAALAGKGILLANLPARQMRNVGRKGARLGARYDIQGRANPTAILYYTGPVHLLNNPTSAHRIEPKSRRRGGKRAITVNGNPRAGADHPGTAGKKFFERSKPQVRKAATEIVARSLSTALRRSF
jgi:hypothetical protein